MPLTNTLGPGSSRVYSFFSASSTSSLEARSISSVYDICTGNCRRTTSSLSVQLLTTPVNIVLFGMITSFLFQSVIVVYGIWILVTLPLMPSTSTRSPTRYLPMPRISRPQTMLEMTSCIPKPSPKLRAPTIH